MGRSGGGVSRRRLTTHLRVSPVERTLRLPGVNEGVRTGEAGWVRIFSFSRARGAHPVGIRWLRYTVVVRPTTVRFWTTRAILRALQCSNLARPAARTQAARRPTRSSTGRLRPASTISASDPLGQLGEPCFEQSVEADRDPVVGVGRRHLRRFPNRTLYDANIRWEPRRVRPRFAEEAHAVRIVIHAHSDFRSAGGPAREPIQRRGTSTHDAPQNARERIIFMHAY